ncbi:MAG: GNAT family N-acetyltransferase [Planctomycetota bacterium]
MRSYRTGPTTPRLTLRAMVPDDAAAFHALNSNAEVMRYTHEPLSKSVEIARERIRAYPDFDTIGYGRWACVLRETGAVIGFCGLKWLDDLEETDVGYRFLPEHWGRGLATEACAASIRFGFEEIGLERIIGLTLPENQGSIRVLEKCGLEFEGEIEFDGITARRFAIDRARFEALRDTAR